MNKIVPENFLSILFFHLHLQYAGQAFYGQKQAAASSTERSQLHGLNLTPYSRRAAGRPKRHRLCLPQPCLQQHFQARLQSRLFTGSSKAICAQCRLPSDCFGRYSQFHLPVVHTSIQNHRLLLDLMRQSIGFHMVLHFLVTISTSCDTSRYHCTEYIPSQGCWL